MTESTLAERIAALEAICTGIDRRMDDRFAGSDRHFDRRLQDLDEKSYQRHESNSAAAEVARKSATVALERVREVADKQDIRQNEWRGTVNDIIGTKIDKSEVITRLDGLAATISAQISGLESKQDVNNDRIGKLEGVYAGTRTTRDDSRATIAIIVALASVVGSPVLGALLVHLLK